MLFISMVRNANSRKSNKMAIKSNTKSCFPFEMKRRIVYTHSITIWLHPLQTMSTFRLLILTSHCSIRFWFDSVEFSWVRFSSVASDFPSVDFLGVVCLLACLPLSLRWFRLYLSFSEPSERVGQCSVQQQQPTQSKY